MVSIRAGYLKQQTYESLIKVADHQMDRFELADLFRSALRPPKTG